MLAEGFKVYLMGLIVIWHLHNNLMEFAIDGTALKTA